MERTALRQCYAILGLDDSATPRQIKRAYRRRVKKYHPDTHPGRREWAARKLREVMRAYRLLRTCEGFEPAPTDALSGRENRPRIAPPDSRCREFSGARAEHLRMYAASRGPARLARGARLDVVA